MASSHVKRNGPKVPDFISEALERFKRNPKKLKNIKWWQEFKSILPAKNENVKQKSIKIFFLATTVFMIFSAGYFFSYFKNTQHQNKIAAQSGQIWTDSKVSVADRNRALREQNKDFKGWLKIGGTNINNPVYQGEDDEFYINHNQLGKKDAHGALHISSADTFDRQRNDKNITIFGNNMSDGTMFGTLKRYKNLDFYKYNPNISFSSIYGDDVYKVFAVFVLNTNIRDDNNYVFNAFQSKFDNKEEFDKWIKEVRKRSILNINVDVQNTDELLTLVTEADDFEGANLVVMARKVRKNESSITNTKLAAVNPNPQYPKRWYDEKSIKYPY